MEYKYTAVDSNGKHVTGVMESDSTASLISGLKSQGLIPLDVKIVTPGNGASLKSSFLTVGGKLKLRDLVIFTRQLSSSLSAGILLVEALEVITKDSDNKNLRLAMNNVIKDIRSGSSFSSALARYPRFFSNIFVALIKAGEESGNLSKTTDNLAKYFEDSDRAMQKLKAGIRYPAFVFGFFIFMVFVITIFIVPKFKTIFLILGTNIPLITKIVLFVSNLLVNNIHWIILFILGSIILFNLSLKRRRFRFYVDTKKLSLPIFGHFLRKALIARFARTLGILFSGGVGLSKALEISAESTDNLYFQDTIEKIKYRVLSGAQLSDELKRYSIFTEMFVKMVKVGEKTGKLKEMLQGNADYYDQEVQIAIDDFTSLLEPVLLILIGIVVLVLVVSLYLPIFNIVLTVIK